MPKQSVVEKNPRFTSGIKKGMSREERKQLGKLARKSVPLGSHKDLHIRKTGRDIKKFLKSPIRGESRS